MAGNLSWNVIILGDSMVDHAVSRFARFFTEIPVAIDAVKGRAICDVDRTIASFRTTLSQCGNVRSVVIFLGTNDALRLTRGTVTISDIRTSVQRVHELVKVAIAAHVNFDADLITMQRVWWVRPPFATHHDQLNVALLNKHIADVHAIISDVAQLTFPQIFPRAELQLYSDGGFHLNEEGHVRFILCLEQNVRLEQIVLLARYIEDPVKVNFRLCRGNADDNWDFILRNMAASRDPTFSVLNISQYMLSEVIQIMFASNRRAGDHLFRFLKAVLSSVGTVLSKKTNLRLAAEWQEVFAMIIKHTGFEQNYLSCEVCRRCLHVLHGPSGHFGGRPHRFRLSNLMSIHLFEDAKDFKTTFEALGLKFSSAPGDDNQIEITTLVSRLRTAAYHFVGHNAPVHGDWTTMCRFEENAVMGRLRVFLPCGRSDTHPMIRINDPTVMAVEGLQVGGLHGIRLYVDSSEENALTDRKCVEFVFPYKIDSAEDAGFVGDLHGIPTSYWSKLSVFANGATDRFNNCKFYEINTTFGSSNQFHLLIECGQVGSFWTAVEMGLNIETRYYDSSKRHIIRHHFNSVIIPICVVRTSKKLGLYAIDERVELKKGVSPNVESRRFVSDVQRPKDRGYDPDYEAPEISDPDDIRRGGHVDGNDGQSGTYSSVVPTFALFSLERSLPLSVIQFANRIEAAWKDLCRQRALFEIPTSFIRFELSETDAVFSNGAIVQFYNMDVPEQYESLPFISVSNVFDWLRCHGLMYVTYHFQLEELAYEVIYATSSYITLRKRHPAVGRSLWNSKNVALNVIVMEVVGNHGESVRQFGLEDISITDTEQNGRRLIVEFTEVPEWSAFVRSCGLPPAQLARQLKVYDFKNHTAAQRQYLFLSSAVLEFAGVGPVLRERVQALESDGNNPARPEHERRKCLKEARRLRSVMQTFANAGRRFTNFLKLFLTREDLGDVNNQQQLPVHCGSFQASECVCVDDMINLNRRADYIMDVMTTGRCDEMIIEGVAGAGKSSILADIVSRIVKKRKGEIVVVLAVTNEALENLGRKVYEACGRNWPTNSCRPVAFVSRQRFDQSRSMWQRNNVCAVTVPSYGEEQSGAERDTLRRMVKNVPLIFSTVDLASTWMNRLRFDQLAIQWILIDEASQLPLMPFFNLISRAEKFIIAGDSNQSSIICMPDEDYMKTFYGFTSALTFMSKLCRQHSDLFRNRHYVMLFVSYRCNSATCELMSNLLPLDHCMLPIYNSLANRKLDFLKAKSEFVYNAFKDRGFCILHVNGQQLNVRHLSSINVEECLTVYRVAQLLNEIRAPFYDKFNVHFTVGILAMHQCQVQAIENLVKQGSAVVPPWIEVGTVTSMQGKEYDLTVLSCVESSYDDVVSSGRVKLGFLSEMEHLHVALTRHTLGIFIVTNLFRFMQQSSLMNLLLNELAGDCVYFDPDNETGLSCDRQTLAAWELSMAICSRGADRNVNFLVADRRD